MTLAGRAWSKIARSREKRSLAVADDWEKAKVAWIKDHVPGKSFADIGGMFRYVGEMSFLAEEVGATQVTMFDVGDPDLPCEGHLDWGIFNEKHHERNSKVRYIQGDLEDYVSVAQVGVHDLVFCSGVLYHTPNPVRQLMHLREMTGELLFLSTLTIPDIPGFPQACVYYPGLSADDRHPFSAAYHFRDGLLGIGAPVDDRPMVGYGNCWWGITRSALRAMLRTARFEVVEEFPVSLGSWQTDLVARPLRLDPMLPPVSYYRERGEARARGESRWSYETWYEDQRRRSSEPRTSP
jgi:hypothetical protein